MKKKYHSIAVKQKDNPKLYKKLYYQIAVKPKRQKKSQYTGHEFIRCPLCAKRSFQRNFRNGIYSLDSYVIVYSGFPPMRKFPKELDDYTKNIIRDKIIELAIKFNITASELGFISETRGNSETRLNSFIEYDRVLDLKSDLRLSSEKLLSGVRQDG